MKVTERSSKLACGPDDTLLEIVKVVSSVDDLVE